MSTYETLNFITRQVNIYLGLFILIIGVIGGTFNIIIFTTLKTFRETTSGFYLTSLSIVNIGQLLVPLLLRILSEGFSYNIRRTSIGCKIQIYAVAWCQLVAITLMCLAIIDQYISMSKYRQYSNKGLTQCATILTCLFWGLYSISLAVFYNVLSGTCTITNLTFLMYMTRFHFPILLGILPLSTMTIFSLLAFYNTRTLFSRQINIVRLTRDRQLTAMTLVHAIFVIITTSPFVICYIYATNQISKDLDKVALNNLVYTITVLINFLSFGASFYIYCCVSERFRKQLLYVLMKICVDRQQVITNWTNNQIVPNIEITVDNQVAITNRDAVDVISNQ